VGLTSAHRQRLRAPLAPDRLHKANISGGGPYGVRLPDATAEGLFIAEVALPIVAYLNRVFLDGGFPGPAVGAEKWKVKRALSVRRHGRPVQDRSGRAASGRCAHLG
jgi:hypothetical protein